MGRKNTRATDARERARRPLWTCFCCLAGFRACSTRALRRMPIARRVCVATLINAFIPPRAGWNF